jgi:pimeloyl-ACP methyl ester carboxylesterase
MKSPRIICLHGSPGSGQDFAGLKRELGDLGSSIEVMTPTRPGYPGGASETDLRLGDGDWVLGYSWGSAIALERASRTGTRVGGVILVAPYLFTEKALSPLARRLLQTPVVSSLLLKAMRPKIEAKLLNDTSAPLAPAAAYESDIRSVTTPEHLRAAALEKEDVDVRSILVRGALKDIPVLVIASPLDRVAPPFIHVTPVLEALPQTSSVTIQNSGHALLWQKPEELARIIEDFLSERTNSKLPLEETL